MAREISNVEITIFGMWCVHGTRWIIVVMTRPTSLFCDCRPNITYSQLLGIKRIFRVENEYFRYAANLIFVIKNSFQ